MAIKLTTLGELSQTPQAVTPSLQQTNIPKLVTTGNLTSPARSKALNEQQAVKYAMKMGSDEDAILFLRKRVIFFVRKLTRP